MKHLARLSGLALVVVGASWNLFGEGLERRNLVNDTTIPVGIGGKVYIVTTKDGEKYTEPIHRLNEYHHVPGLMLVASGAYLYGRGNRNGRNKRD